MEVTNRQGGWLREVDVQMELGDALVMMGGFDVAKPGIPSCTTLVVCGVAG